MKEESPMSIHYAKYAMFRIEYIGRKPRNDCIRTIQVQRGYVSACSFSPDGTRILSNSGPVVCVWDATGGELITGLLVAESDESDVLSAAYLPDGRYTIVASRNGIIRKWDILNNCLVWGRMMSDFQKEPTWALSVAFSPDRKSVVFGYNQGTIRVWDVDTGEQDGDWLEGHTYSVNCLSFSPNGEYLASGSEDTAIMIWDMDKRRALTGPLRRHTWGVRAVSFSPCGTNLASGSLDGTILVWNALTGEVLRVIKCEGLVYSVTYSPDGLFVLAGGVGWMRMWNVTAAPKLWGLRWMSKRKVVTTKAAPKVFQVDRDIRRVSFSPDGSRFVSRSDSHDDVIQIWDASWSVEKTRIAFKEQRKINSISLSPSGRFIASGSREGSVYLWNVLTGELSKRLYLSSGVDSVVFSPINEDLIAFGSNDRTVQMWDVTRDEPVTIGNLSGWVTSVAFSPSDGKHIASGSSDDTIHIWDVNRRKLAVGPLTGHTDHVLSLAYSPDGTRLVSGSHDKTVRIWNSETGQLLSTLNGHSERVNSVAYSFDGSRIVSGSDDATILVWDAQSGQIVCGPITGDGGSVTSVCFSPDGNRILSGSGDKTARVWDAITGKSLFPPFNGHTDSIKTVCFFPDGRRFATGSEDGTIRIWTFDTVANDTNWELRNDNWVVDEDGKPMMWIPKHLHTHLCGHRNISILNRSFYLKLHFGTE